LRKDGLLGILTEEGGKGVELPEGYVPTSAFWLVEAAV
jgi:hypothetical protein